MHRNNGIYLVALILVGLLVSCGPSPEAKATMTAAVWTPTPTPLPYDLELTLTGEDGESVFFNALVTAGEYEAVLADEDGKVTLLDLPGSEVTVSVVAQGYEPYSGTVSLERGKNMQTLALSADPAQINPATACGPGQKVLYIEDFEDEFVQDWEGNPARPIWEFEDVADRGKVLTFTGEDGGAWGTVVTEKDDYGNMVWKFDIKGGDTHFFLHGLENESHYTVIFQPGREGVVLIHQEKQEHRASAQSGFNNREWVSVAISYFDGSLEFWINDELLIALDDPAPIEKGGLGLLTHPQGAPLSLDNLVICELNEPYAPVAMEVVEE